MKKLGQKQKCCVYNFVHCAYITSITNINQNDSMRKEAKAAIFHSELE